MRLVAPLVVGLAAMISFSLEGAAFASWAIDRSTVCRGEPSLACAADAVTGMFVAQAAGVLTGIGVGTATAFYLAGRPRAALWGAAASVALLAGVHVLLVA